MHFKIEPLQSSSVWFLVTTGTSHDSTYKWTQVLMYVYTCMCVYTHEYLYIHVYIYVYISVTLMLQWYGVRRLDTRRMSTVLVRSQELLRAGCTICFVYDFLYMHSRSCSFNNVRKNGRQSMLCCAVRTPCMITQGYSTIFDFGGERDAEGGVCVTVIRVFMR